MVRIRGSKSENLNFRDVSMAVSEEYLSCRDSNCHSYVSMAAAEPFRSYN